MPIAAMVVATFTTVLPISFAFSDLFPIIQSLYMISNYSIKFNVVEIVWVAAGFFVVETVEAHVCLLYFFGAVGKGIGGVHGGGDGHSHFGSEDCAVASLDAFWCDTKDFRH